MKTDENFKKDLCDSLHICDIERIPKISKDDVIARYINLKIGEIVRIEKRTENSGICNVFKLCV
jgi:DNA-directed RNA polymerase subunit H (RpoH/RPB5)